jgi:hypothetical protein
MGRKKSTGRYESREALCLGVWGLWIKTKCNISDIATVTRVSVGVVSKIIDSKEFFEKYKLSA